MKLCAFHGLGFLVPHSVKPATVISHSVRLLQMVILKPYSSFNSNSFKVRVCDFFYHLWMQANMNDALMGILRVQHLISPPYLTADPSVNMLRVDPDDQFVIIGSDGLFDFFTNDEVVNHIHQFLCDHPAGDPAKFMIDHLLLRVADNAGIMLISCISQSMSKLWFGIFF